MSGKKDNVPNDFNWKEYVTLNHYLKIPKNMKDAKKHYNNFGFLHNIPYNFKNTDVIVYSGAKTGSTTLASSFRLCGVPTPRICAFHSDSQLSGIYTIDNIINTPREGKVLIVCSYREPVSQIISTFFQNIYKTLNMGTEEVPKQNFSTITDVLIKKMTAYSFSHPFLENNRNNVDNINIFDKPFNREFGFQVFETDKIKLILLRFDKMDNWKQIIINNTPYKKFKLIGANLTKDKPIYQFYKQVYDKIIIPKDLLDRIYDEQKQILEYFYNEDEIKKIKERWYNR